MRKVRSLNRPVTMNHQEKVRREAKSRVPFVARAWHEGIATCKPDRK